ncbi:MAG: glycoside hydrolase family 3 protein [Acidimicrobiales bacterium]
MNDDHLRRLARATLMPSFPGLMVPDWLRRLVEHGLGGVCLFAGNLASGAAPIASALHGARPDVLVALDEEGGDVTRLEATTGSSIPGNAALGAVDDVGLTERIAAALGAELRAAGIDLDLAPVADVNSDPENPVIGVRSFGSEPEAVGRHVAAFITGLHGAGVAACAKHFPGHGATTVDSHLALPVVDVPIDVLVGRELVPFRAAVDAGVAAVMTAHLVVPVLDDRPATISRRVLNDVLRGELQYAGAVVTDALDMAGIGGVEAMPLTVVRALAAGADLCCLGSRAGAEVTEACVGSVVRAVTAGELDEDRLADAAARVALIRRRPPDATAPVPGALAVLGEAAARRALRVEGERLHPVLGAHVVELAAPPGIAVGDVPWGMAAELAPLDPASTAQHLSNGDDVDPALDRAFGRALVIVTRDPHRHPSQARHLAKLVAARPDAVVVDLGWPSARTAPGPTRIVTYGASRASRRAASELLVGRIGG